MSSNQTHREAQFGPWMRAGNIMMSPLRDEHGKYLILKGQSQTSKGGLNKGNKSNGVVERMEQKELNRSREEGREGQGREKRKQAGK